MMAGGLMKLTEKRLAVKYSVEVTNKLSRKKIINFTTERLKV